MALFRFKNDTLVNTYYIVLIGPVLYNNTSGEYYCKIYLSSDCPDNLTMHYKTDEECAYERNKLINFMGV